MDFGFLFLVFLQIHWPLDWLWLFGGLALWSWQLLPNVFWVYGILSQDQSCYFLLLSHTCNFKGFPLSLRKSCLPGSLFCLMLTEALKLSLRLLIQFSVHASLSHTHPFPFNLRWAKGKTYLCFADGRFTEWAFWICGSVSFTSLKPTGRRFLSFSSFSVACSPPPNQATNGVFKSL